MMYVLGSDVRILFRKHVIYIRKGVWNIESGEINLSSFPVEEQERFATVIYELQKTGTIDSDVFSTFSKIPQETFHTMIDAEFILPESQFSYSVYNQKYYQVQDSTKESKFFVIVDKEYSYEILNRILVKNNIDSVYPTEEEEDILNSSHNVDSVDTIFYQKSLDSIKKIIKNYPVILIQENVNLSLIRILNRSLDKGTPLFLGFLDGPFLIYLSILSGFSACFECFEQNLLVRIQDHQLYKEFLSVPFTSQRETPLSMGPISFLIYQAFTDAWSFHITGKSQFCSRVLQIYLPTFEIQYQDILRSPICPNCGYLSDKYVPTSNISLHEVLNRNISQE